jgi:signal transduction histidine kinase/CheY-like chemotaxis protein
MSNARILIVDDEAQNRRLLEAILVGEGYEVVEAPDGAAGLEVLTTSRIDLVLLDVMMPMSGMEVCRRIRANPELSHLPVVFVTALGDRESRIRGKDVGADDFLTKPVDDVELLVRVRTLLRFKAQHDAKERQRRLMSAILDSMGEGVVAADDTGYTLWNPAAEDILGPPTGWPAAEAWPGPNQVVGAEGHTGDGSATPLAGAFAGELMFEQRVLLGGDNGRHLSVSATPLPEDGPGTRGAVAVFRDVTELVELDRFKHEMTSLVVHDLKNVMTVIGSSLEYAAEVAGKTAGDLFETLSDARDAAARANRLVVNLMDVARLENRRITLKMMPIEPAALCHAAVRHRVAQLKAHDIALAIVAEDVPPIRADLDILQRVLDNVLDNAVRYTPRGGRIQIAAVGDPDGTVRIRIGNTGPAIADADRLRIFEKYGQGDASGGMNAGLGLYFCRLALAAHGGRIWVETAPELPAMFVIELPPYASATAPPPPASPKRRRRQSTGSILGK